ncbi:MAG TPA: hypothetical protein VIY49_12965 [Bryobacteraceae bacterium]
MIRQFVGKSLENPVASDPQSGPQNPPTPGEARPRAVHYAIVVEFGIAGADRRFATMRSGKRIDAMKEVLTRKFWKDVKKTFEEARDGTAVKAGDSATPSTLLVNRQECGADGQ